MNIKCQTSTKILSLGIKHSARDLIYDVREPDICDMGHIKQMM